MPSRTRVEIEVLVGGGARVVEVQSDTRHNLFVVHTGMRLMDLPPDEIEWAGPLVEPLRPARETSARDGEGVCSQLHSLTSPSHCVTAQKFERQLLVLQDIL